MSGELKVEVNPDKLAECIKKLNALSEKCKNKINTCQQEPDKLSSQGHTPDELVKIMGKYNDIRTAFINIIDSTTELLENAKDGIIDVDENSTGNMNKLLVEQDYQADLQQKNENGK